jgi:ligand-binding sensor domain-containing protein/signal transduction histidine kinase
MRSTVAYRWVPSLVVVLCLFGEAHALDSQREFSQYVREQWSAANGLPGGAVHAIAQSPDGYLWIGTDKGLVRFDGFTFRLVPPKALLLQNDPILALITDAEGQLWVRMQNAGILRYNHGAFESLVSGPDATVTQVTAIARENTPGMLLSDLISGTLRLRRGKLEVVAPANILPGSSVTMSIAEAADGKVWLGTLGAGLFYLANGRATRVTQGLSEKKINCLLPIGDQELWVGTDHGLFQWNGKTFLPVRLAPSLGDQPVLTILRDRDSNIWVGTALGLLRINARGTSIIGGERTLGGGAVNTLFEDREGNLWIGGTAGLERIRDSAFVTYSAADGLSWQSSGPVYVDGEGRTWFAPEKGGLYWIKDDNIQAVKPELLGEDAIYSIAGHDHEIWIGRRQRGLTRLDFEGGIVKTQTYSRAMGLAQNSVYVAYQSRDGSVWAGTLSSGISRLKDGRFTSYTTANGLVSNTVSSILEGHDGTMWFGTPNGLSALSNGKWRVHLLQDGLPSDDVNCLFEDSAGFMWIGTSAGLAYFAGDRIHTLQEAPESLREQIVGMAEDKNGRFWIATSNHVLRVPRDKLVSGVVMAPDVREYGKADGLESTEGMKRSRSVVSDSVGRIWFSLNGGLSVVNPSEISDNSVPAVPQIEAITADNNTASLGASVRIPPSPRRITFQYTGLSLAVPARIRFRYFLEGFDSSWSQPAAAREAVYTNLGPGSYRFRLVASNSLGQWNGLETAVAFNVEPALWQTWWLRSLFVLALGLAAMLFYRIRLRQLTRQLNVRFEERLAERTRIAQELHDTFLQGLLSASMQLSVANDQLVTDSPAKSLIGRVLELMARVAEDGRNAVRGLRITKEDTQDLDQAFSRIPQELAVKDAADFRVIVAGGSRPLHPMIHDEIYRIGREAVANAFRHAAAKNIEVELEYGLHELRVLVRDDGRGIDPEVLHSGRDGHWGLSGMRERAEGIGAKLRVLSRIDHGTEIDLRVPGRIAFESRRSGESSKWMPTEQAEKEKLDKIERGKRAG